MTILFSMLQITRSDIRLHIAWWLRWPVNISVGVYGLACSLYHPQGFISQLLKFKALVKNQGVLTVCCTQAAGYTVWVDVEQMGGSTLEAMALAIENARCVLVGLSEKYKLSPNCRTGMSLFVSIFTLIGPSWELVKLVIWIGTKSLP